jgi:hypothetical protein
MVVSQLAAVHLVDAHHITDASKYVALLLLSLRTMLQLELPHINVLSKIDLLGNAGELRTSPASPLETPASLSANFARPGANVAACTCLQRSTSTSTRR